MAGGMVLLGVLLIYFDVATGMLLFSIIQLAANGWRALHWRRFVLWPIFCWYVLRRAARLRGDALHRLRARQGDGLHPARPDAVHGRGPAGGDAAEHRMARRAVLHRHLHHRSSSSWPASAGCSLDIFFQKSALDRKTTNATKAIDPDLQPRAARGLFRLARRHRRSAGRALGAGDRAGAARRDAARRSCSSA